MTKKKLLKELLCQLQNSRSDAVIHASIPDGFMTDSEAAHDAILCIIEMIGCEDLVSVEEAVHYGILHYCFHFNVEEDLEEIRAAREESAIEVRVYLEDNEIRSVHATGDVPIHLTEIQLYGNIYDDDFEEYESAVRAHWNATSCDSDFHHVPANHFDWKDWASQNPDLVAAAEGGD